MGYRGANCFLAYVHSQMNPQTCTKFGANQSGRLAAFPDLKLWPPKPPRNSPWGSEGRLVFCLCPFPDESADMNQSWCQSVQPFYSFPRLLNVWPPKKNPSAPLCLEGNLFGVYPFPDESAHVCQIWCQSVQPFDSFRRLLNLWPPKTTPPEMPPGVLRGELYLAYVNSQTNLQTCTKFGANRSSRLTASQDLNLWPPKSPEMPPGVVRGDLCFAYVHSQMNPQTWTKVGANRSSRLTASPDFWMFDPLKKPKCVSRGICLAYIHSQMNLNMCAKFGANRCSRLTASQDFWICDPLNPPKCLWCIEGRIVFSRYPFPDESADVYQIWCQSIQPFDSLPTFWICDPLKPPMCPLCVSRGNLIGVYLFPNESAHVCQLWCQSVQPFDSFSPTCVQVSSSLSRCTRQLAQKHTKKQYLYIEDHNSSPNMLT